MEADFCVAAPEEAIARHGKLTCHTARNFAERHHRAMYASGMSLPHAVLTALIERPCSGSELAERFDRSIGFFWSATHQQIYRELARLESAGLIVSLPEESTRGRKRAYQILPAGRDELERWIGEEQMPSLLRDDMMVRLWAEAAVGPTRLPGEIHKRLAVHEKRLAFYRRLEARDYPEGAASREAAIKQVVLQTGIRYEAFWIESLRSALMALGVGENEKPE